ncbi:MAG TPA: DUF4397 domain-containing protein [Terriglobales bacterium]|nr:DUF4397 domain-containing protein [Terriglobales bacterium]
MIRLKPAPLGIGLLALITTLFSTGCGSGSTQVRLMNAMDGQGSVNMLLDNNTVASGVAFGSASAFASSSAGSHSLELQSAETTLLNLSVSLNGGNNNTILATNSGATVFQDNKSAPSSGNFEIRVINAAQSLGTVDVYIVAPGTDISTVNPSATALAFQSASGYLTLAAGSFVVEFAQAASKNVILATNPSSFISGQIRTVVSLDGNGVFSTAVLSDLN